MKSLHLISPIHQRPIMVEAHVAFKHVLVAAPTTTWIVVIEMHTHLFHHAF